MQAGPYRDTVSFQRVIVPLLRLVTQPRFSQSTLTQLRNPVLATLHSELPLDRVQQCIAALAATGSITDPRGSAVVRLCRKAAFLSLYFEYRGHILCTGFMYLTPPGTVMT